MIIPLLYYSPGACSLASIVTLEWIGEPYELCRVERDARRSETYRRINPRAQVPSLGLADRVLTENAAILTHFADAYPDRALIPRAGTWARDEANQWLSYLGTGFHPAFYPYFVPSRYVLDPALEPAIKSAAIEQIRAQMAYVDDRLQRRDFVHGEARTVLDPYLYAMSRWTTKLFDVPREFPNVARHQARLSDDPAVQYALKVEREGGATSPSGAMRKHSVFTV